MNKEFVPYEQALELKKLGFDEPCFGYYTGDKKHLLLRPNMGRMNEPSDDVPTASTFSQVFRWFREKYNLMIPINKDDIGQYYFSIHTTDYCFEFYDDAELECLKKLIEIVKNGK